MPQKILINCNDKTGNIKNDVKSVGILGNVRIYKQWFYKDGQAVWVYYHMTDGPTNNK